MPLRVNSVRKSLGTRCTHGGSYDNHTLCSLYFGFFAYKIYCYVNRQLLQPAHYFTGYKNFSLSNRLLVNCESRFGRYFRDRQEEEHQLDHAVSVLDKAREAASYRYAEVLLHGTAKAEHRDAFECDWENAKEAIRARYGDRVLNHALSKLKLD